MFRIPELLAPAGGMEQLKAAVENGADAVYMGGKRFNARINADNFDTEEMKEAIDYAHLRGVRLYVTMNTLLKDGELSEALEYAAALYSAGADALILQDLGFAALVREHIPGFQLHLSTQGTVYNAEGVKKAGALGFSRVVLARELTLAEIKEITEANSLDVEVFVHGALCICYSGQCQMSREIGGRSGNRGVCAQPCRLPYSIYKGDKEVSGSVFALSPKDLCTLEQLGRLSEAGVASLKIEGRMKSPEYVAVVTGIYRKYLDLYAKDGHYQVEAADLKDLSQIFNRGGFTEGYLHGNPKKNLMSGDLSKHQGIYIGKVVNAGSTSKKAVYGKTGNRQSGLVNILLSDHLAIGDGIEIRNRELSGNVVTYLKCRDKKVERAVKGELVTVGDIDGSITPGDPVYKITDKALMQRGRASYEGKSGTAEKALRKMGVSFHFSAGLDRPILLKATDEEGNWVKKELTEGVEKALTKAITDEIVIAQLSKTGGTTFRVTACTTELEEGISIPLSKINELRRAALEELEDLRRKGRRNPVTIRWRLPEIDRKVGSIATSKSAVESAAEEETFLYFYQVNGKENIDSSIRRIYVPYDAILNGLYREDDRVVPVIPNITKGWHDQNIRKNFDKIVATSSKKGIAIGNLGWIEPFVEAGLPVIGDYGLNLFNSMDFLLAGKLGIKEAIISHEVDPEEILVMNFHGVIPEVVLKGKIPLMTSEYSPVGDLNLCAHNEEQERFSLKDRKGQFYPILTNHSDCGSVILSHKETNLLMWKDDFKKSGIKRFRFYVE